MTASDALLVPEAISALGTVNLSHTDTRLSRWPLIRIGILSRCELFTPTLAYLGLGGSEFTTVKGPHEASGRGRGVRERERERLETRGVDSSTPDRLSNCVVQCFILMTRFKQKAAKEILVLFWLFFIKSQHLGIGNDIPQACPSPLSPPPPQ